MAESSFTTLLHRKLLKSLCRIASLSQFLPAPSFFILVVVVVGVLARDSLLQLFLFVSRAAEYLRRPEINGDQGNLERRSDRCDRRIRTGGGQCLLPAFLCQHAVCQAQQHTHYLRLERASFVLYHRSGREGEQGCCVVLSIAETCCSEHQGLRGVLERSDGRESRQGVICQRGWRWQI